MDSTDTTFPAFSDISAILVPVGDLAKRSIRMIIRRAVLLTRRNLRTNQIPSGIIAPP
jgi:hypothetical protein